MTPPRPPHTSTAPAAATSAPTACASRCVRRLHRPPPATAIWTGRRARLAGLTGRPAGARAGEVVPQAEPVRRGVRGGQHLVVVGKGRGAGDDPHVRAREMNRGLGEVRIIAAYPLEGATEALARGQLDVLVGPRTRHL